METIKALLASKKFIAFAAAFIGVIAAKYGLEIDDATITKLVALVVAYLTGQGLADIGKEAKKIESENPRPPDTVKQTVNIEAQPQ